MGQRKAIARIRQIGGSVWLRKTRMGKTLVSITFWDQPFGDGDVCLLSAVENLENLWLGETTVSDLGPALLNGSRYLKSLQLQGTYIDDAGFVNLHELPRLQELGLGELSSRTRL